MDKMKSLVYQALRKSEKFTKTDMVYLARGGFWLGIGQVVTSLSAFFLSIAFANLLPASTYGTYKYVFSINAILLIATLSGIDNAVTQSISRKKDGTLIVGLKEKTKWGFIGSAGSIVISLYYYFSHNNELSIAFLIAAIFIPLTESLDIYNSLLQGKKLFSTYTIFNSVTQVTSSVALFVTMFFTKNILALIFVFLFTNTLLNGLFLFLTNRKYSENSEVDEQALTYGKKLSGLYIIATIASELDKLLVFHFLGAIELAVYTVAVAPTEQLKALLKNVQFVVLPKIAENQHKDIRASLFKKTFIFGLLILFLTGIYILVSPIVFKLAFPKYPQSILYTQLLSISVVAAITSSIIYTYVEVKRSEIWLTRFHIWSNVINVSLLFVGIYYFGLMGLIVSRIISRFLILGLTVKIAEKV